MNIPLDTHVFLWWVQGEDRLSETAFGLIAGSKNTVYYDAPTFDCTLERK